MTRHFKAMPWFAGAFFLLLLALYCFAGVVMNGSFAVAEAANSARYYRNANFLFWGSVASVVGALGCLVVGVVRMRSRRGTPRTRTSEFDAEGDAASAGRLGPEREVTQSVLFSAGRAEWGTFTSRPAAPQEPNTKSHLPQNVITQLAAVQVEGLSDDVQFAETTVEAAAGGVRTRCLVVCAYPPFPAQSIGDVRQKLAALERGALCMIVQDRSGWARATAPATVAPEAVAAAIAHTKVTGGWDESTPIAVEVNGCAFDVTPELKDSGWQYAVHLAR